jgi:hypothetical protein
VLTIAGDASRDVASNTTVSALVAVVVTGADRRQARIRDLDDRIEIRWPALFFGFRRCVYVTWTSSGVEFRNVSGGACTEFIG